MNNIYFKKKKTHKTVVVKTVGYWHKEKHTDQWNRNKPSYLWSIGFHHRFQDNSKEKISCQQMVLRQLDMHMQRSDFYTPNSHQLQNELTEDCALVITAKVIKLLEHCKSV